MSKLFIPGPITGIIGAQGSGKSFVALKLAFEYANKIEYDLCFNFSINVRKAYYYCLWKGYTWLVSRIRQGKLQVRSSSDIEDFMKSQKTLYILDEAGIYLCARNFQNIPSDFLRDLAQIRHDHKLLWWLAQYHDMVDRVLRDLSASFIQADCITRYSKRLNNFEMVLQRFFLYDSKSYRIYLSKVVDKCRGIRHLIRQKQLSMQSWILPPTELDLMLFDIYQSFGGKVQVGSVPVLVEDSFKPIKPKFIDYEDLLITKQKQTDKTTKQHNFNF